MNNQVSQNRDKTRKQAVTNTRRRFLKGAGATTPVLLTLASPSVFGVGCLSQQLSGNLSHPGNSCVLGNNPAYWRSPVNSNSWSVAGYDYGTGSGASCGGYTGGTTFNTAFAGGSTLPMRQILCSDTNLTSLDSYFIAALLNSHFVTNYVLTPTQVMGLYNGSITPPGGDVQAFLATTWA